MQPLIVKVTGKTASPALPGNKMSLSQFKRWIKKAETTPSITLEEAKLRWADKRKQIQVNQ